MRILKLHRRQIATPKYANFPKSQVHLALAVLIPVAYFLPPLKGAYFYAGIMGSVTFGGSVTAILLGIPGTASSIVTVFDGHAMAKKGKGLQALAISATACCLGAFFGYALLALVLPFARQIVLAFGAVEEFWLIMFGIVCIPFLFGGSLVKGLAVAALGILLSSIGSSPSTGELRFTMGIRYLSLGVPLVPFLVIGIFVFGEVLTILTKPQQKMTVVEPVLSIAELIAGVKEALRQWVNLLRSSTIGAIIGIIPGLGSVTSSSIAYAIAKAFSRHPETFGSGNPEGIVAPEAANDAKDGGALIPIMIFGIPGSMEMAILIGVLSTFGVQAGPRLILQFPEVVWSIFWALCISDIIASSVGLLLAIQLAKFVNIQRRYIGVAIFCAGVAGAYLYHGNFWDVMVAMIGGGFGYTLKKFDFPLLPFVIAFILGPMVEERFYQSLSIGLGAYDIFFRSGLSITLIALLLTAIAGGLLLHWRRKEVR